MTVSLLGLQTLSSGAVSQNLYKTRACRTHTQFSDANTPSEEQQTYQIAFLH